MTKPVVYISSPMTKGDVGINVRFQCEIFDRLMRDGIVWPVAPAWSHWQHCLFPAPYETWIQYDLAMLERYDALLRLNAFYKPLGYHQAESLGADREVARMLELDKPVFTNIPDLYAWVRSEALCPQA